MIIILKKIPANTNNMQIKEFIKPALKGGVFSKSGRIDNISFLVKKNIKTQHVEYHALVTIMPDSVARRVIKKLNGKRINGKHIVVNEYRHRSWHNDPRINPIVTMYHDRRKGDRRCDSVEVGQKTMEDFSVLFSGETRLAKKLNDDGF